MTKSFLEKTQCICLLTPDEEPTKDESTDITEVQLVEPKSFIGVTNRSVGEELLLTGTEMSQRQLHHQYPP